MVFVGKREEKVKIDSVIIMSTYNINRERESNRHGYVNIIKYSFVCEKGGRERDRFLGYHLFKQNEYIIIIIRKWVYTDDPFWRRYFYTFKGERGGADKRK